MPFHFTDGNYEAQEAQGVTHSPKLFFFSFLFLLRYIFSCYLVQKSPDLYRGSDLSYTCSTVLSVRRGELNPHFCHRKLRFRGGGFLLQPHS